LLAVCVVRYIPLPNVLAYRQQGSIPFISYQDTFPSQFGMVAGLLALALGLWQSLGDFWGDAHLFVLHRPASRRRIYGVKLLVGVLVYLLCAIIPLLLY